MTCQQQRRKPVKKIYSWGRQERGSGMTLDEFKLLSTTSSHCSASPLAPALFLTSLLFSLSRLATAHLALAVWLCPSYCQPFCLCYRLQCLNILLDCNCLQLDALSAPAAQICLCCFFVFFSAPKWDTVYSSNCHVKLCMYASSCKANKSALFLHSWWLCQKPQQQKAL